MEYKLIDTNKAVMPIDRMCRMMAVSVSGYYAWKERRPSLHQCYDVVLSANIRAQFASSNQTYGAPRMHAELRKEGLSVSLHRVVRLMRENGLKAHQKRRFKKTTDSQHDCQIAFNILDQNFACDGPDQKWGADISYIWKAECWLYLAIVLDLYSRRIVGWGTSDRLKKGLALKALEQAILMRRPPAGLIHHSDRGSQYCSDDYRKLLQSNGLTASMNGKGIATITQWSRPTLKLSKLNSSGEQVMIHAPKPHWHLAITSTASIIHAEDTQHWDTNRPLHSKPKRLK